jgi:hypothetical protein
MERRYKQLRLKEIRIYSSHFGIIAIGNPSVLRTLALGQSRSVGAADAKERTRTLGGACSRIASAAPHLGCSPEERRIKT